MTTEQYICAIKKYETAYREALWAKRTEWADSDMVLLLYGHMGIGKSTAALSFCHSNPASCYFSFRNIESGLAPAFFSASYSDRMRACTSWKEFFDELKVWSARKACVFFFDDVDDRNDKADFYTALTMFLKENENRRAFVVLIMRSDKELAIKHRTIAFEPLTLRDISKLYPNLSREDILRVFTLTGGIPTLVSLYDFSKSYPENLRSFLLADSMPCRYVEQLLSDCFRAPECYNTLMYAMASGCHRISAISEFSGYASNKCDKYLKALFAAGLITTNQKPDESGRLRTHYSIKNSFLLLWFRYLFPGRSKFSQFLTEAEVLAISTELDCAIIKSTFRDACFRQLENLRHESLIIGLDAPKQYDVKIGEYVFDFVQKDGDRVLFVKIWDEIGTHVDKAEFTRLENAASKLVPLYNGIFILFSIHRFSDYCWKCAGKYENVKLVQVEELCC